MASRQMRVREEEKRFIKNEFGDLPEPSAVASLVAQYKLLKQTLTTPKKGFWKD